VKKTKSLGAKTPVAEILSGRGQYRHRLGGFARGALLFAPGESKIASNDSGKGNTGSEGCWVEVSRAGEVTLKRTNQACKGDLTKIPQWPLLGTVSNESRSRVLEQTRFTFTYSQAVSPWLKRQIATNEGGEEGQEEAGSCGEYMVHVGQQLLVAVWTGQDRGVKKCAGLKEGARRENRCLY